MRRARPALLGMILLAAWATRATAQGSVFSFRGLGWAGRPVSARTAGTAGALAMFDPTMSLNPAALARWRSLAAWGVSAPTQRSYEGPSGTADQQSVRFPLMGFATVLQGRAAFGFSVSDYLDRTWTVSTRDSTQLRGATEPFTDAARSVGGVSDMALGAGYRVSDQLHLGVAFHYYLGSTRLTAQRVFDNTNYTDILEQSLTDYRGAGLGAGLNWASAKVDIALSGRVNGNLRSANTGGSVTHVPLPAQFAAGLRVQPVRGVYLAGSASYDGWGRASTQLTAAGLEQARNVWSLSAGAEVPTVTLIKFRTPLRVGYRWRQLPFTSQGDPLNEWAVSGGIGFSLAREHTLIDVGAETGAREAGPARETFTSIFVGLTVRP